MTHIRCCASITRQDEASDGQEVAVLRIKIACRVNYHPTELHLVGNMSGNRDFRGAYTNQAFVDCLLGMNQGKIRDCWRFSEPFPPAHKIQTNPNNPDN